MLANDMHIIKIYNTLINKIMYYLKSNWTHIFNDNGLDLKLYVLWTIIYSNRKMSIVDKLYYDYLLWGHYYLLWHTKFLRTRQIIRYRATIEQQQPFIFKNIFTAVYGRVNGLLQCRDLICRYLTYFPENLVHVLTIAFTFTHVSHTCTRTFNISCLI